MTFSNPETALCSNDGNQVNQHSQANCLRARPVAAPSQKPPLTSTPIPNKINQYARKGGIVCHRQQICYYNYPGMSPVSSDAGALTQVLSTYVPGTTVLYLDPKEKPTLALAPRVRFGFIAVMILLILALGVVLLGGSWMKGTLSLDVGLGNVVSAGKNYSKNFAPRGPPIGVLQPTAPEQRPTQPQRPEQSLHERQQQRATEQRRTMPQRPQQSSQEKPRDIVPEHWRLPQHPQQSFQKRVAPVAENRQLPEKRIIFSFDDDDLDNEARVEAL